MIGRVVLMKIRDILARDLVAVDADAPIHHITETMKTSEVGMLPVIYDERVVGIVTDRDLVVRALAPGIEHEAMTAWDVMSRDPVCIDSELDVNRAVDTMRLNRVRRLVVTESGTPIGVVSLSDLCPFSPRAVDVIRQLAVKPGVRKTRTAQITP